MSSITKRKLYWKLKSLGVSVKWIGTTKVYLQELLTNSTAELSPLEQKQIVVFKKKSNILDILDVADYICDFVGSDYNDTKNFRHTCSTFFNKKYIITIPNDRFLRKFIISNNPDPYHYVDNNMIRKRRDYFAEYYKVLTIDSNIIDYGYLDGRNNLHATYRNYEFITNNVTTLIYNWSGPLDTIYFRSFFPNVNKIIIKRDFAPLILELINDDDNFEIVCDNPNIYKMASLIHKNKKLVIDTIGITTNTDIYYREYKGTIMASFKRNQYSKEHQYVINLATGRPTSGSPIQTQIKLFTDFYKNNFHLDN